MQETLLSRARKTEISPAPHERERAHSERGAAEDVGLGTVSSSFEDLLARVTVFADDLSSRPNTGSTAAPLAELQRCTELGLLTAPLPREHGGLGLGTAPGGHATLLRILSLLGGADLALARLYEGHINGLILVASYGTPEQVDQAAHDALGGALFGVWNTGAKEPLKLTGGPDAYELSGEKTFASGADFVRRPIVTGEHPQGGWQMFLPHMETRDVANAIKVDRSFWHPLGMESSESYRLDFSGASVSAGDLIGKPGDFYLDPLFRGGAVRFAAAQAGAVIRLHRLFAEWLDSNNRGGDPYQAARLGEIALAAQTAVLWIERAAETSEAYLKPGLDKPDTERMVEFANMMRLAIERLATETMQRITAGVGAHGLLQPLRFERILRDLTTYLRQPAPDQALAEVGRASLRKTWVRTAGATDGFWRQEKSAASLPPSYFRRVYERSTDPWSFQTSAYEAAKYADTLRSLPAGRFANALEIGCSIGVLTCKLATCCDALLGIDVSERALASARERCRELPQVRFERMEFPREAPDGTFDLVVVSEVAYYWQREDLERAADTLAARQQPGGHLLLVHLTEPVPDYPLTGDQVHESWLARPEWRLVTGHREGRYRLDLLQRGE